MATPPHRSPSSPQSWDTYWQGTGDASAYSAGGVSHPLIHAFWQEVFQSAKRDYGHVSMLDIATGNGALVEQALGTFQAHENSVSCLDVSPAAVANIRHRFPGVRGVVADAAAIPFDAGAFDLVTSQFGAEYAGADAIIEASRLVKGGGRLVMLIHNSAGSIYAECTANLDAVNRLKACGFVPLARELFRTGFAACRGADRAPYEAAARQLQPAVTALEGIMTQYGEHVAGDTIARLYDDVARIHENIQSHDADEVLGWLRRMDSELDGYAARMSSMRGAAMDDETFNDVCDELRVRGHMLERAEAMISADRGMPLAWVLVATHESAVRRSSAGGPVEDDAGLRAEVHAWTERQLDASIRELMAAGMIGDAYFEARPAWVLPFQILIGRIRKPRDVEDGKWFINGELPIDCLEASTASTPREAARHFALKWQLESARQSADSEASMRRADDAEALYALVDDESLWL